MLIWLNKNTPAHTNEKMRTTGELKVSFITIEYSYFCGMTIKYKASQYSWMKLSLLFIMMLFLIPSQAQIVTGEEEDKDEEEKKEKKEKAPREKMNRDSLSGTTYYLTGLFNYGHRRFEDKSIAQSYTQWNDVTADYSGGFNFGVFLPVGKNLDLDLGFTFFGQKEQYNYSHPTGDSTFHYSNNYMQIGVPVRLRYTYGSKFQVFGYAGLTPINTINIRYRENYTRADGATIEGDPEVIKDAKLSIFNLIGTVGLGITYNFDWIGITLYPEYRQYFFNTYDSQVPVNHKMYGLGVNAGFTLRF